MRGRIALQSTSFEIVCSGDYISRERWECALTARLCAGVLGSLSPLKN